MLTYKTRYDGTETAAAAVRSRPSSVWVTIRPAVAAGSLVSKVPSGQANSKSSASAGV
jgi:hypothetical protein